MWTETQQTAFETLKEKLTNPPVLAYADYRLSFKLHTDASTTGLVAVLYQHQDGQDRVVSYASRSLKPLEKNYPAHKLELIALKWSVTEKFNDYLYGTNFEVFADNNPLTYVFTTAKLDATGHRWLAELSNYNFSLTYRSGKRNAYADGLSRLTKTAAATSVFPDVLKAICNTVVVQRDTEPMVDSLAPPDIVSDIEKDGLDNVPADMISTTALTSQDWQKAQAAADNINYIVDAVLAGVKPTSVQFKEHKLDVG